MWARLWCSTNKNSRSLHGGADVLWNFWTHYWNFYFQCKFVSMPFYLASIILTFYFRTYTIYSAAALIYYQCFLFYFIKWTIGRPIAYGNDLFCGHNIVYIWLYHWWHLKKNSGGFSGCSMSLPLSVNWSLLSGHWFIESFDFEVRRKNYEDFIFLEHFFYFVKKTFFISLKT